MYVLYTHLNTNNYLWSLSLLVVHFILLVSLSKQQIGQYFWLSYLSMSSVFLFFFFFVFLSLLASVSSSYAGLSFPAVMKN